MKTQSQTVKFGKSYIGCVIDNSSLNAQEDVEFRSSETEEYPPEDFEGEWLHVNDHGNATLYVRSNGQDSEIWSIV